jgi:hypothetical protein
MSNTGNDEQKGSQERLRFALGMGESSDADCSPSAGNLDANWEILGNISSVVLSRLMKSRGKQWGVASPGNMLKPQLRREGTQGEIVASNSNESGGVDTGGKVFGAAPEAIPQRAPDTDERNGRKDPTCQWSMDW